MKRLISLLLIAGLLAGCATDSGELDKVLLLRSDLQKGNKCSFDVDVTADYGDSVTSFTLTCASDNQQNMRIVVQKPESISGVSCEISGEKGSLTFDEKVLAFEMIADGQLTPISAPWLMMKALRGGYISAISKEKEGVFVRLDDSYSGCVFSVDLWLNENNTPEQAEIVWQGKRIMSMRISNYEIL